ncbi:Regulator of chromosome condensation (RCC1) [Phytophthora cinnamomi]|uniref:Regulator of chromosome condensation (RCC1) n=1 Tax=Phytophthora cinnamomi TaxID=4785 RepID=UPI003559B2F4|nr:Regulator of chromosome condensation (RCC1) [Phytophthora cinnamomi]
MIKEHSQDKRRQDKQQIQLLQAEKDKLLQEWADVKTLREDRHMKREEEIKSKIIEKIDRADRAYESRASRRVVQLEDTIPEFTARGENVRIEMSGVTTRGPPLHSPRGAVSVANVSAGGSHVALLMQDGEFPFKELEGKEGLRAAKVQSSALELFRTNKRMTEWILPTANTVGQYVRVQLQNKNFLHFAEVEVFGVYSAFNYVGRVGTVQCSADATLVVMPPTPTQSVLDDYYLRAIQADADHATILRQYNAYDRSFRKFGRGSAEILDSPCRLCRVFRDCEVCEFYASAKYNRRSYGGAGLKPLPVRLDGDRMGLEELVRVALAEGTLEAEQQECARQELEAAERALLAQEAAALEAERQRAEEQERSKRQSRLLKPFQGLTLRSKKV